MVNLSCLVTRDRDHLAEKRLMASILDIDKNMVLKLEFLGNCSSCNINGMTLKAGVEEVVRKSVPEISKIEAINLFFSKMIPIPGYQTGQIDH